MNASLVCRGLGNAEEACHLDLRGFHERCPPSVSLEQGPNYTFLISSSLQSKSEDDTVPPTVLAHDGFCGLMGLGAAQVLTLSCKWESFW